MRKRRIDGVRQGAAPDLAIQSRTDSARRMEGPPFAVPQSGIGGATLWKGRSRISLTLHPGYRPLRLRHPRLRGASAENPGKIIKLGGRGIGTPPIRERAAGALHPPVARVTPGHPP